MKKWKVSKYLDLLINHLFVGVKQSVNYDLAARKTECYYKESIFRHSHQIIRAGLHLIDCIDDNIIVIVFNFKIIINTFCKTEISISVDICNQHMKNELLSIIFPRDNWTFLIKTKTSSKHCVYAVSELGRLSFHDQVI